MKSFIEEALDLVELSWVINISFDPEAPYPACYCLSWEDKTKLKFKQPTEHNVLINAAANNESHDYLLHCLVHEFVHAQQVERDGINAVYDSTSIPYKPTTEDYAEMHEDLDPRFPWNWHPSEREAWETASKLTGHNKEYWLCRCLWFEYTSLGMDMPPLHPKLVEKIV